VETVGIRDLKNRLSSYIHLTKSGETIIITDRGRPVALLKPIESGDGIDNDNVEHRLALLAKKGLIRLPSAGRRRSFKPVRVHGGLVSSAILEDRQ